MRLAELLETYLANPVVRLKLRRQATIDHYRRSLKQFEKAMGRPCTVADLTTDNLALFATKTLDEGLAVSTAKQRIKQLNALWRWAAEERLVEKFPRRLPLREPERLPEAWRPHELRTLFEHCGRLQGWIGPHQARDWATALHYWLYCTGERIEATLQLRPSMLDLESLTARVPAEIRKGGQKAMAYRLTPVVADAIAKLIRGDDTHVFCHHWRDRTSFYAWYRRKVIQAAGLRYVRHKSGPHKMRVTVLTAIDAAGGDACAFARHSSRTVTDSYIDRELTMASQAGVWPPVDFDPLTATRELRVVG